MLEDADEGGVRLWHLVKASEEPELPKHRRGSLRDRERAKAIPEIYLTRLLSMKVTTPTGRVTKRSHPTTYADLLLDCTQSQCFFMFCPDQTGPVCVSGRVSVCVCSRPHSFVLFYCDKSICLHLEKKEKKKLSVPVNTAFFHKVLCIYMKTPRQLKNQ